MSGIRDALKLTNQETAQCPEPRPAQCLSSPRSCNLLKKQVFRYSDVHTVVGVQSLSRAQLCKPMDCSTPGFPVLHHLSELAQTQVH